MASDTDMVASGIWHPAGSSQANVARLVVRGRDLLVELADGRVAASGDLAAVTISARVGRIPRRLSFSDGSLFETDDNEAIDRLLSQLGAKGGFVHELERFHPRLIALVAAVFVLAGLIYRYALPVLVEVAVWATPPVVTEMMAASTFSTLDKSVLSPSALPKDEQAAIRAKFDAIAAFSARGAKAYMLHFRKGGYIGPNAFALPDGSLLITDELIAMAGGDTEMILGVLAHEIGHVEKNHSLRQLYRAAGTAGLIMLIAGDVGSGAEEILTDGAALLALSYSRAAEAEADRVSAELMVKAGHDPAAIGRFFALLEKKLGDHGETSMFSTHPGTPERRKEIERYARILKGESNPCDIDPKGCPE